MNRSAARFWFPAIAVLVLSPGVGSAQIGCIHITLETLVAESDVVIRGTIIAIERDRPRDNLVWLTITLDVRETLKGEPARTRTFAFAAGAGDESFEQRMDAGQDQLWFLVRNEAKEEKREADVDGVAARYPLRPYGGAWSFVRLGKPVPAEAQSRAAAPPIFDVNLNALGQPWEILNAARAAAKVGGGRKALRTHGMNLPHAIASRSGQHGDANMLVVPVDSRLEKLALRWIRSPEEFRSGGAEEFMRIEGVRALRYFKSEANVTLLKRLLDGSGPPEKSGGDGLQTALRKQARTVLREWGVADRKSHPAE